jgi:Amt family ammonium transporter
MSTALVLFMTIPGLALFYGGLVRTKNVLSVLMQCFALTALVTVIWLVAGYSLAFDTGGMTAGTINGHSFIGTLNKAFLHGVAPDALWGSIPEVLFFMFQLTFAIITPALIVGAFAERMKFSAMILFSAVWLVLVYLPICHMTWGGEGGFLADMGALDFAGGIVVHLTAGTAALVTAVMVGAQLKTQSIAAVITILWTLAGTYIALKVASIAGLRVHADDEEVGLDLTQHTERGYDI